MQVIKRVKNNIKVKKQITKISTNNVKNIYTTKRIILTFNNTNKLNLKFIRKKFIVVFFRY